jgi:DNA-binding transcriptional regulator YhcF (GntR family)
MDFKKPKTIYQQIAEQLCDRIIMDEWKADERMVSVRDVALQLEVNPNTVLRSFDTLQQNEIIYNKRGVGYFVSPDAKKKILKMERQNFYNEDLPPIIEKMKRLDITIDDLKEHIH